MSAGAAPPLLAPRAHVLQMLQLDLLTPFESAPTLLVAWGGGGGGAPTRARLKLPVLLHRFLSPWQLSAEDYFKHWRGAGHVEKQLSFQFNAPYHAEAVKASIGGANLSVLERVDPVASNLVAAGTLSQQGLDPSAGGCLLRLELNLNYARGQDGTPRAAARSTPPPTPPLEDSITPPPL